MKGHLSEKMRHQSSVPQTPRRDHHRVPARDPAAAEALDCSQRLAEYYGSHAKPHERTARFMERIGMDTLKSDLLQFLPYIPIEKVK